MAIFKKATPDDIKDIIRLRQTIWSSTYRGIYDDDWIDSFDFEEHEKRELVKLQNPSVHVFLIVEHTHSIGYLTFSKEHPPRYKDFPICLDSLYILPRFQGKGIGAEAMNIIKQYCKMNTISKFYNQCNAHNTNALAFYSKMGGIIGHKDIGNNHKFEDSIWLEHNI